jgi:hypothetical protein
MVRITPYETRTQPSWRDLYGGHITHCIKGLRSNTIIVWTSLPLSSRWRNHITIPSHQLYSRSVWTTPSHQSFFIPSGCPNQRPPHIVSGKDFRARSRRGPFFQRCVKPWFVPVMLRPYSRGPLCLMTVLEFAKLSALQSILKSLKPAWVQLGWTKSKSRKNYFPRLYLAMDSPLLTHPPSRHTRITTHPTPT